MSSVVVYVSPDSPEIDESQWTVVDAAQCGSPLAVEQSIFNLDGGPVLIKGLTEPFHQTGISMRECAQIFGRIKKRLRSLASNGADIVLLCRRPPADLGVRSLFFQSLRSAAHTNLDARQAPRLRRENPEDRQGWPLGIPEVARN